MRLFYLLFCVFEHGLRCFLYLKNVIYIIIVIFVYSHLAFEINN